MTRPAGAPRPATSTRATVDPLVERGAEALAALINDNRAEADEQVRLLTLSELTYLATAAEQLAGLARAYVNKPCGVCDAAITWYTNEPTGQARGWRHVDQAASYRFGAHRATPVKPAGVGGVVGGRNG